MSEQLFHQIMKEWYWLVIVGSIVSMAFAPSFLKGKCPCCGKRKLVSVETDSQTRQSLEAQHHTQQFLTFYSCDSCHSRFFRERTGPFQDASAKGWDPAFAEDEHEEAALVP
jgi:hypothetical protein